VGVGIRLNITFNESVFQCRGSMLGRQTDTELLRIHVSDVIQYVTERQKETKNFGVNRPLQAAYNAFPVSSAGNVVVQVVVPVQLVYKPKEQKTDRCNFV
jgi:hypothetical protein